MDKGKGFEDIVAQIEYELGISGVDEKLRKFAGSWDECKRTIKILDGAIADMGAIGLTCGPSLETTVTVGDAMAEALRHAKLTKKHRAS